MWERYLLLIGSLVLPALLVPKKMEIQQNGEAMGIG